MCCKCGVTTLIGRLMLTAIFFLSAVGNKIPNFDGVVGYMQSAGVPSPRYALMGAIAFLIVGSVSVALGFKARIGASLLLVFLTAATYYFHAFWKLEGQEAMLQQIQFMKNLGLAGAMVMILGNGPGLMSFDEGWTTKSCSTKSEPVQIGQK
jgi:putative oxidoreductase